MSDQTINNKVKILVLVLFLNPLNFIYAATEVTGNQASNTISWLISGNSYAVESVNLSITGSENSGSSTSGCTSSPLNCSLSFNGTSVVFDTSSLSTGSYNWQIEIVPQINELDCNADGVREAQGGLQGLGDGHPTTPEAAYLNCLRSSGFIPADDQELYASGSFAIQGGGGLIVPDDQTTPTDNALPIALCVDVTIEGSSNNCSVSADINNGSYDPDGTIASVSQSPDGPYGLGVTNVILTVTDDTGDSSSCGAIVTVTDSLAPEIQCPIDNTMSPNTAPATFAASTSDTCSVPDTQVVSYDCYRFNPHGKRIDTNDSCVVSLANDSVTVIETSGVDSFIDWTIEATDSEGNTSDSLCTIEVLHPNS
jgi:hypothetical protein